MPDRAAWSIGTRIRKLGRSPEARKGGPPGWHRLLGLLAFNSAGATFLSVR